ncbi:MAG: WecB/TagA/CpsF family glycosyltransferase [Rhodospirillales bacterium]|nr:WecB/TagA/CpsF family glycosyltransferase [Rhodospirillales bacterium]
MILPKNSLLGLPITYARSTEQTLALVCEHLANRQPCIASFINPSAFHLRLLDQAYANTLWHFDLILPDGIGVALAAQWINQVTIERQSFDETSLFNPIMNHLDASRKSLCIIGARPGIAARCPRKMKQSYPNITYLGALDGYRPFDERSRGPCLWIRMWSWWVWGLRCRRASCCG